MGTGGIGHRLGKGRLGMAWAVEHGMGRLGTGGLGPGEGHDMGRLDTNGHGTGELGTGTNRLGMGGLSTVGLCPNVTGTH
jgi:hypothetical protein